MNSRLVNWLFGLVALGAIGAAVYFAMNNQSSLVPDPAASSLPKTATSTSPLSSSKPISSASPSALPASSNKSLATANATLSLPGQIATVPSGGSLVTVAAQNDVTIDQLAKVNNLTDANKVFAGQSIIIPDDVSANAYTLLFTLNDARLAKEKAKLASGGTSIYSDVVIGAIADTKGLFDIVADTPFSTTMSADQKSATLSTSSSNWAITIGSEKQADNLWIVKRLVAKK